MQFATGTDKTQLHKYFFKFLPYLPNIFVHHTMSGLLVPHGMILRDHQYTALHLSVSLHHETKKIYVETLPSSGGDWGRGAK